MPYLKQSTTATVVLGAFVDATDGFTAETALTISQADIRLSKNGGAFAQTNNAAGATHMENGHYSVPLDTTDTNTLGRLRVAVSEGGARPVTHDFEIVPANVWDSLFSTDRLQVDVQEMGAGTITAAAIATDAIDADALADNAITAATFASGAINATAIASDAITAAKIAADAITAAKIADGAIDANTFAAGAITAAAIAADAIGASELAADAVTEIATAVNAEVVDCLNVDTYAELSAVPSATATLTQMIRWLFLLARNKRTQTTSLHSVRNDADTLSVATQTCSDDTSTFTVNEWT